MEYANVSSHTVETQSRDAGRTASMSVQPYSHLIRCKQWADDGLLDVVAANIAQLDAAEASIVVRILDHFHVVDQIFQHHLQGLPHAFEAPRSAVMPDLARLTESTRAVDAWYVGYVDALAAADFDQPVA